MVDTKGRNITEVESRFTADAGSWIMNMRVHFGPDDIVELTYSGPELGKLYAQAGERIEREIAARC